MEDYIPVDLPVSGGEWDRINSPAERVPSHETHYFGQTFAFDLAQLNPLDNEDPHKAKRVPVAFKNFYLVKPSGRNTWPLACRM